MPTPSQTVRRGLTLLTHRIHSLPVVVLSPHSRCNCRCVMCDIWRANRDRRELSPEQLADHVEDLRRLRVEWIVLTGGEPLMHSNLWALCRLFEPLGARITLLSTGLLLERWAAEVTEHCDEVIVSLDGTPPVHDAIRNVPRAFEQLATGVASLKRIDPSFRVTARSVVQRRNFRCLPEIVSTAREIGLDAISLLAADVTSTAFNRPLPWEPERVEDVALSAAEADELVLILEQLIDRHPVDIASGFLVEGPEKLRAIGRYYLALAGDGELPPVVCNAPWVSTVVEVDGTVRPCFFHPPLGNLEQSTLSEILNGKQAIDFRRRLDVTQDPICRRCVCTLHLSPRAELKVS